MLLIEGKSRKQVFLLFVGTDSSNEEPVDGGLRCIRFSWTGLGTVVVLRKVNQRRYGNDISKTGFDQFVPIKCRIGYSRREILVQIRKIIPTFAAQACGLLRKTLEVLARGYVVIDEDSCVVEVHKLRK